MFNQIFKAIIAILFAFSLEGCVSNQALPDLPSTLGPNNGLLVARLYLIGMHKMENAGIMIDGQLLNSSLRDGYIAVPLAAGVHTLTQLRAEGYGLSMNDHGGESPMRYVRGGGGAPIYIFTPGRTYTTYYTTLSVNRTFRIEEGKVTNLGLMVYLPDEERQSTLTSSAQHAFKVFSLDNNAEIKTFLQTNYPELFSSLKDKAINLAPARYFDPRGIPALRRAIAVYERTGPNVISSSTQTVIYGKAGTIVVVNKPAVDITVSDLDALGTGTRSEIVSAIRNAEALDTGTLSDIVGAIRDGEQFKFVTSDGELLSWDGSKLTKLTLPHQVQPILLHPLGKDGLVVIDNHVRILTSHDGGGRWTNFEEEKTKKPRDDVNVIAGNTGIYIKVGNKGMPDALYFLKEGESIPKKIAIPDNKSRISNETNTLLVRDAGLYLNFDYMQDFYFLPKGSSLWALYSRPDRSCGSMTVDEHGNNLEIMCTGVKYQSNDSGKTWKKPQI